MQYYQLAGTVCQKFEIKSAHNIIFQKRITFLVPLRSRQNSKMIFSKLHIFLQIFRALWNSQPHNVSHTRVLHKKEQPLSSQAKVISCRGVQKIALCIATGLISKNLTFHCCNYLSFFYYNNPYAQPYSSLLQIVMAVLI